MEQKEFWRKALLFGFGVWDFTKQKVEALVEEMVKRGEISQQESPEAVEQIMAKAKETNQALFAKVKELTSKALSEMKVARANDLEALEKRVAALEKELVEREIEGREGPSLTKPAGDPHSLIGQRSGRLYPSHDQELLSADCSRLTGKKGGEPIAMSISINRQDPSREPIVKAQMVLRPDPHRGHTGIPGNTYSGEGDMYALP